MRREQIIEVAREAGIGYFRIRESDKTSVDALERFWQIAFEAGRKEGISEQCKISVPTDGMEQAFSTYHRRGFTAGAASRDAEIAELIKQVTDLLDEIDKADKALSKGNDAVALTGVRLAASAAYLTKQVIAKVRKL